ncbi:MAG: aldehyde ferredoxin oxidoreductase C-terminal domain-containing protein, partial [Firmicutes bacterium]|nr:aldehyde ferredoxin oxidoreductase C-terminal domain-containing protein [Bacillota bacterium]
FGGGSEAFAMHAKGMELGGYDPRGVMGMALCYACGPRGGCHHAGGRTVPVEAESGKMDRFASTGKAAVVRENRDWRAVLDSAVLCTFNRLQPDLLGDLLSALTGRDWNPAALREAGERISNLERLFNVREGIRRRDDILPRRLLEEPLSAGPSAGHVVSLEGMLDEFYAECGWDRQTGIPTREKIRALKLDGLVEEPAGPA